MSETPRNRYDDQDQETKSQYVRRRDDEFEDEEYCSRRNIDRRRYRESFNNISKSTITLKDILVGALMIIGLLGVGFGIYNKINQELTTQQLTFSSHMAQDVITISELKSLMKEIQMNHESTMRELKLSVDKNKEELNVLNNQVQELNMIILQLHNRVAIEKNKRRI